MLIRIFCDQSNCEYHHEVSCSHPRPVIYGQRPGSRNCLSKNKPLQTYEEKDNTTNTCEINRQENKQFDSVEIQEESQTNREYPYGGYVY